MPSVARLVATIDDGAAGGAIPLLVLRIRDFERIAWRQGRSAARALERRTLRSFVETAARVLRASDLLAHDADSEDFLVALATPMRRSDAVATPTDCRAALARLGSALETASGMVVDTGWTVANAPLDAQKLRYAIDVALERGARERERFGFFSTIGHELRTPLTSIRGYLETLLEEDLPPETARRFLEVARHEAMRMGRLVDGMFDLSLMDLRADLGGPASCDLNEAIALALDVLQPAALVRGAAVAYRVGRWVEVAVAQDRLLQILTNVVENAIKHGRDGGRVYVTLGELDDRYVEVRIDDDGPGVPFEEREEIFALARRGANVRARGSGLGLAVVRLILERIGGEVDVADSVLGGARFRIRLPLASTESESDDSDEAQGLAPPSEL